MRTLPTLPRRAAQAHKTPPSAKKFDKGSPDSNILFEDSQTAILYRDGQRRADKPLDEPAALLAE